MLVISCSSFFCLCLLELCLKNVSAFCRSNLIGSIILSCENLCESSVCLLEVKLDLTIALILPELEGSGSLEELSHTLWLLYARKLDEDTSAVSKLLDVWLGHTETVDTVSEDVE